MIKLADLLKEIQEERQSIAEIEELLGRSLTEAELEELNLKRAARNLGAGLAFTAATLGGGAKAQSKIPTDKPAITVSDTRTGTDVDGINGYFTSQFEFPTAFMHDINSNKILDLGIQGNEVTKIINSTGLSVKQMGEWNNFVKWMKSKGYSGTKQMNNIKFNEKVLDEYKQKNPGFWVKDGKDIEKIQTVLKAYRLYTIASWKLGVKQAVKLNFQPVDIQMSGKAMDSTNSEDVKRVESNYMLWAK
jgi:hypothetical protein